MGYSIEATDAAVCGILALYGIEVTPAELPARRAEIVEQLRAWC